MLRESYSTVQDAEDYLNQSLTDGVWLSLSPEQKQNSLFDASQFIDVLFDWKGDKSNPLQLLAWPRKNASDCNNNIIDDSSIPNEIIYSTILLASSMSAESSPQMYDQSNVTKVKVGPIDISLDASKMSVEAVPDFIKTSLRCLGTYIGPKDSSYAYNVAAIR